MKVVIHLLSTSDFAGAENVAMSIIKLSKNTNSIYVSPKGSIVEVLIKRDIKHDLIETFTLKDIWNMVKIHSPDVIHAHDFNASVKASLISSFFKLFKIKNIKVISHIHHNPYWMSKINLKTIVYLISTININKILTVSNAVKSEFVFSKLIKKKIIVLKNIIDESIVMIENKLSRKKHIDILFVGRLTAAKNPLRFLKISKELIDLKIANNIVVVGDGDLLEECNNFIDLHNLNSNVTLIGFDDNPYKYMSASKLMLLTSKWEGFSLVTLEAMLLGVPVVSTDVGGIKEVIGYKNELFYESDEQAIVKVGKLLTEEKYRKSISEYLRNRGKVINNHEEFISVIEKKCYKVSNK